MLNSACVLYAAIEEPRTDVHGENVEQAARWQHFTSSLPADVCPVITQLFAYFMNKPVILSHN